MNDKQCPNPDCKDVNTRFAGETTGEPAYWCGVCGTLWYQDDDGPPLDVSTPIRVCHHL